MEYLNREFAMNLLKKWLSLIGVTLLTATAFAGGSQSNVTVTGVQAGQAGPQLRHRSVCHSVFSRLRGQPFVRNCEEFFCDRSNDGAGTCCDRSGLMAYAQGKTVSAAGAGTCTSMAGLRICVRVFDGLAAKGCSTERRFSGFKSTRKAAAALGEKVRAQLRRLASTFLGIRRSAAQP